MKKGMPPSSAAEEAAVSTYDLYTTPVNKGTWDVPSTGAARFSWEYDDGRERLLDLYQRGKDKPWDATKRIDWSLPVDPCNVMATSEEFCPIYGSRDRKSTRLNSSHSQISYAVFCLQKKT